MASALEYAHRHGILHRDIKPENILLHEGEAMVADFGVALAVMQGAGERLTETGLAVGTPQYMSPEQATGERALDARSDVYSLGAVLYEMLAGEPPLTGPTAQAVIAKLLTQPRRDSKSSAATCPTDWMEWSRGRWRKRRPIGCRPQRNSLPRWSSRQCPPVPRYGGGARWLLSRASWPSSPSPAAGSGGAPVSAHSSS